MIHTLTHTHILWRSIPHLYAQLLLKQLMLWSWVPAVRQTLLLSPGLPRTVEKWICEMLNQPSITCEPGRVSVLTPGRATQQRLRFQRGDWRSHPLTPRLNLGLPSPLSPVHTPQSHHILRPPFHPLKNQTRAKISSTQHRKERGAWTVLYTRHPTHNDFLTHSDCCLLSLQLSQSLLLLQYSLSLDRS